MLSTAALRQIKTVQLSYFEPTYNASVTTLLDVVERTRVNSTAVELVGTRDHTSVRVWNGKAHLLKGGVSYPVCYSAAGCSSVKVSESEVEGLIEAALDALESIGVKRGAARRLLQGTSYAGGGGSAAADWAAPSGAPAGAGTDKRQLSDEDKEFCDIRTGRIYSNMQEAYNVGRD